MVVCIGASHEDHHEASPLTGERGPPQRSMSLIGGLKIPTRIFLSVVCYLAIGTFDTSQATLDGARNALKASLPLHRQLFFPPTKVEIDEGTIQKSREKETNIRKEVTKKVTRCSST